MDPKRTVQESNTGHADNNFTTPLPGISSLLVVADAYSRDSDKVPNDLNMTATTNSYFNPFPSPLSQTREFPQLNSVPTFFSLRNSIPVANESIHPNTPVNSTKLDTAPECHQPSTLQTEEMRDNFQIKIQHETLTTETVTPSKLVFVNFGSHSASKRDESPHNPYESNQVQYSMEKIKTRRKKTKRTSPVSSLEGGSTEQFTPSSEQVELREASNPSGLFMDFAGRVNRGKKEYRDIINYNNKFFNDIYDAEKKRKRESNPEYRSKYSLDAKSKPSNLQQRKEDDSPQSP